MSTSHLPSHPRRGLRCRTFTAVAIAAAVLAPASNVLAVVPNPPADGSAPGAELVTTVLGWLKWAGLASALAGLLIGAITTGIGHFGSNYSASSAGRPSATHASSDMARRPESISCAPHATVSGSFGSSVVMALVTGSAKAIQSSVATAAATVAGASSARAVHGRSTWVATSANVTRSMW